MKGILNKSFIILLHRDNNTMEPKIRFKGFEGEWQECSFRDILKVNSGKDYKHLENGIIPVYGTGGYMLSVNESLSDIDAIGIGRKGTIDKPQYLKAPFWTVDTLFFLTTKNNDNLDFLYNLSQNIKWKKYDESTGVPSLSKNNIDKIETHIPYIAEQQAIASYFASLDSQISASTSRLASLKQIKAASLQAMFPQEGETMPKVRFKGFEEEWKKTKYSSLATIRRGLTYKPENIVSKGIRVLRSSNIEEDTFLRSKEDVFVHPSCINIPLAKDGDILITAANGSPRLVGKHAVINNLNEDKVVPGVFMILASSKEPYFLNSCMGAPWYKTFLKSGVAGGNGAIGNLNKNALEEYEFYIPSNKLERDKLASYFTNLDHQISLHAKRLEKLKHIKDACLEKMFV